MRKIVLGLGSAMLLLAGALSANAATPATDAGPVKANSQIMEAADQAAMHPMNIRQQIQNQLGKDGYTDVTIMPSSFLVRAKNKAGDPVEMVIGPDTFTQITEIPDQTAAAAKTAGSATTAPATTTAPKQ